MNTDNKNVISLDLKKEEKILEIIFSQMSGALSRGENVEIRGFGSFSLHYRAARVGRNPKTGEQVQLAGKHVPHFKPGKEMRDRVNDSLNRYQATYFNP